MGELSDRKLDDDIARILDAEDVTDRLLADASGPGEDVRRVREARPAKSLTPSLSATLEELARMDDRSGGHISNFLAYSKIMRRGGKSWHRDLVRLMRSGHVRVMRVNRPPVAGSTAHAEAPYGHQYYVLDVSRPPGRVG